ncbi:unnamed protein product, partial [Staurois parvus]
MQVCSGHSDTGWELTATEIPMTTIQRSVLIKSTDTVLMTLGRKGLAFWVIKGLIVCCATCCCVFICCAEKYTATCPCWQERDLCCLYTGLSSVSSTWQLLGAGGESPAG